MHGDFLAELKAGDKTLIGGLSLLSGYVNQVRAEEENVLFVIAGDMLQGSLIDADYKGISTIDIMNYLSPDVVALGNHEFDYGLPHLLFLEKMANFPIVNANLYIKKYNKRMMTPFLVIKKAGFDILFTGILTDKIKDSLAQDKLVGSFVSIEEASREVGRICNAYKNDDIDLTILLTHIGYESDLKLAKLIDKDWGVDLILGGHTHTVMDQPAEVNKILIAQTGGGTNQIGRFDITVDDQTNAIIDYKWRMVPITNQTVKRDEQLEEYIQTYQKQVDSKYSALVTKLGVALTHPHREEETTLGNFVADAFAENSGTDVMLVGSGSIRVQQMGPLVTLKDFLACFPYDDVLHRFEISGKHLKAIFSHIMRQDNRNGEGECYQVNAGVKAVYSDQKALLKSLRIAGKSVRDEQIYTICMQGFHFNNSQAYLNISNQELLAKGNHKVVTTSAQDVLEEYLRSHQNSSRHIEGRLSYL